MEKTEQVKHEQQPEQASSRTFTLETGGGAEHNLVAEVGSQGTRIPGVIWPDPDKMNFSPDRRDPYSELSQEQYDRRTKRREENK